MSYQTIYYPPGAGIPTIGLFVQGGSSGILGGLLIPVNTSIPTIFGIAQVAQTLTATDGAWTNSPTSFSYQWNRAGTPIIGANGFTYNPVNADIGKTLTVSVVAINGLGSSSPATSAATFAIVAASVPANTQVPLISGTPQVGQTLTGSNGNWDNNPTSFTYQWQRSRVSISGATSSTYIPVAADVGNNLTILVTAINFAGSSIPASSAITNPITDIIPTITSLPLIFGAPQVGQTLTTTNGIWTHNPTSFTYQWNSAGVPVLGATSSTYIPVAADVGNAMTVSVIATNSGGSSLTATSAATGVVVAGGAVPVSTSVPTITGTLQVGQTLTSTTGAWTNSPTSFSYQWNDDGVPIGGATASTFILAVTDIGDTITVSVTAANGSGSSVPATSTSTGTVVDILPSINTAPSIPGTPQAGTPATAIDAVWNHTITSLAYQWKAAGVNGTGAGATTLTYVPVVGDVGKTLTITVTATNTGGTSSPATSAVSAVVIAAAGGGGVLDFSTATNSALFTAIGA